MNYAVCALVAVALPSSAFAFAFGPGEGGAILDDPEFPTSFELDIEVSGPTIPIRIEIDFAHNWAGDLTVTLEHNGVVVTLLDRLGAPEQEFGNGADFDGVYFFDDNGADWAPYDVPGAHPGEVIPAGVYGLNNSDGTSLADFDGIDIFGTWTLTFHDAFPIDDGFVRAWYIHVIPSPGACAILGGAVLGASGRRR